MLSSKLARGLRQHSTTYRRGVKPLHLNPHLWEGLPADQVFELHNLKKRTLGEKYNPNDQERNAILNTITSLTKKGRKQFALDYIYEIDNFKERYMNNVRSFDRGKPQKKSNVEVLDAGATHHEKRRIEHLTRITAYQMPLLTKFRQPYQPTTSTESPIQIIYQTDFSNETNNEFNRKVKLRCYLKDLNLNEKQQHKFKLLAGDKFNHNFNYIQIKSENLELPTQNARVLVNILNKLIIESKDLSKETFDDIPIDTRHMKNRKLKQQFDFPTAWNRPQDAPIEKHQIITKFVKSAIERRDDEFIKEYSQ